MPTIRESIRIPPYCIVVNGDYELKDLSYEETRDKYVYLYNKQKIICFAHLHDDGKGKYIFINGKEVYLKDLNKF